MRTPSPPYSRLDLAPLSTDRFVFGVAPLDYGPVLLLMPFGFRLATDTLPSGEPQNGGFRSALAVSDFRLRARLGFSIPSTFPQPARSYSRFWIQRSSFERRRDLNPPELCAAQRTVGLIHTPGVSNGPGEPAPALFELRSVMMNPAQDGRVYQADSPLGHDRYQISRAQLVAQLQY
jgi:hypothetical protein